MNRSKQILDIDLTGVEGCDQVESWLSEHQDARWFNGWDGHNLRIIGVAGAGYSAVVIIGLDDGRPAVARLVESGGIDKWMWFELTTRVMEELVG